MPRLLTPVGALPPRRRLKTRPPPPPATPVETTRGLLSGERSDLHRSPPLVPDDGSDVQLPRMFFFFEGVLLFIDWWVEDWVPLF